jgi:PII-like signaling protein
MTSGYLKLTAYFGERARAGNDFLSDALLDIYGGADVATSVVLRGVASFGPRHQLRSDQSLSMSEDPPIAVAAVDVADKMAGLANRVVGIIPRGLITLERARLVSRSDAVTSDTAKLTVYVGRQTRVDGKNVYHAICDALYRSGFAGASVFLGVDGTTHGRRTRARFFSRNADVPVMIIAVGSAQQVSAAVADLETMPGDPLWTVERVQVCKRDGKLIAQPTALPPTDDDSRPLWQKLMIYTSEATRHDNVPIHRALVRRLLDANVVGGATVLRGVWGFHGDHQPHGDSPIQLGRRVPVTTIIVDTPARIAASFEIVDELTTEHGLVTSELVPALVSIDGLTRIGDVALARYDY